MFSCDAVSMRTGCIGCYRAHFRSASSSSSSASMSELLLLAGFTSSFAGSPAADLFLGAGVAAPAEDPEAAELELELEFEMELELEGRELAA